MAARKPGRPKKPEGETLGARLEIRVTAEERERMQLAATEAKKTLSEWLRGLALEATSRP